MFALVCDIFMFMSSINVLSGERPSGPMAEKALWWAVFSVSSQFSYQLDNCVVKHFPPRFLFNRDTVGSSVIKCYRSPETKLGLL